ncbi:spastin [Selaginella moellendorffii]|uniref:spastin n=1 Tax=Selaginella moellendorffii TaxID=88036 RepID=UPI000D1CE5D9|nr:spastin [Selaginella moellendorffii]|eukprot:XP_024536541.1 spastin [Selaginella moellendorffii]
MDAPDEELLSAKARGQVIEALIVQPMRISPDFSVDAAVIATAGYNAEELKKLCKEAGLRAVARNVGAHMEAHGGSLRQRFHEADLQLMFVRTEDFMSGYLLLCGPSGCGKRTVTKAACHEARLNFVYVEVLFSSFRPCFLRSLLSFSWFQGRRLMMRGPDSIEKLFSLAKAAEPTLVYFDETEELIAEKDWDKLVEVVKTLLASDHVRVIMAAKKQAEELQDATKTLEFQLPEETGREVMLRTLLTNKSVADDVDFQRIAELTEKLTYSDLRRLVR